MIIYWGLLIWSVTIGGLYSIFNSQTTPLNKYTPSWTQVVVSFAPVIFFAGMKGRGIIDSGGYILSFQAAPPISSINLVGDRLGFRLLETLFKDLITDDYQAWIFFLAFISSLGIIAPLRKYSSAFGLSFFLWIASTQFTWLFNGVRQYLVVCIVFSMINLIVEKRKLLFITAIFILSYIHHSVLIMIPAYFIAQIEPWSKKMYLFFIGFIVFSASFTQVAPAMTFLFEGTEYEKQYSKALELGGINYLRTAAAFVPVLLAFILRKRIKKANKVLQVSVNMTILTFCIFLIASFTGGNLFGRFAAYVSVFWLIAYPWLLLNITTKKIRPLVIASFVIIYVLWFNIDMGDYPYFSQTLNIAIPGTR